MPSGRFTDRCSDLIADAIRQIYWPMHDSKLIADAIRQFHWQKSTLDCGGHPAFNLLTGTDSDLIARCHIRQNVFSEKFAVGKVYILAKLRKYTDVRLVNAAMPYIRHTRIIIWWKIWIGWLNLMVDGLYVWMGWLNRRLMDTRL